MFDIDLSSYYYGHKLQNSEIVDKIIIKDIEIMPEVRGYEAVCHLNSNINIKYPDYTFHLKAAGVGSSENKRVAIYKSISEALERWAYSELSLSSTAGLAAFPSIYGKYSKQKSKAELIERYCLNLLNSEQLNLTELKSCIYTSKINEYNFVLVKSSCQSAYGFSCHVKLKSAIESASIEMFRNLKTIEKYKNLKSENLQERRLMYFASEGKEYILNKIKAGLHSTCHVDLPKIRTLELDGPWSRYSRVFQSQFKKNISMNNKDLEYFYF